MHLYVYCHAVFAEKGDEIESIDCCYSLREFWLQRIVFHGGIKLERNHILSASEQMHKIQKDNCIWLSSRNSKAANNDRSELNILQLAFTLQLKCSMTQIRYLENIVMHKQHHIYIYHIIMNFMRSNRGFCCYPLECQWRSMCICEDMMIWNLLRHHLNAFNSSTA